MIAISNNLDITKNVDKEEKLFIDEKSLAPLEEKNCHRKIQNKDLYFEDGIRIIDYILVYEENTLEQTASSFRNNFIDNLLKKGIDIEETVLYGKDLSNIHFLKLHLQWDLLIDSAESLNFRVPLKIQDYHDEEDSGIFTIKTFFPFMKLDIPKKQTPHHRCIFKRHFLTKYHGYENKETFFTKKQRIIAINEILESVVYGNEHKSEIGIKSLINMDVFKAAYPLHEGPYEIHEKRSELNNRQILYEYWAKWSRWYKMQPLDDINEYFGEKIALYFAWLGFYTSWLLPAAVVGIIVFIYALITVPYDKPTNDLCVNGSKFLMCRKCDHCKEWLLNAICLEARLAYISDSPGAIFYAVFISLWATTFLEFWKRKNYELAYKWNVLDYVVEIAKPRPSFVARAKFQEANPITGIIEASFPKTIRTTRMLAGTGIIFLMASIVIIFIFGIIIYRIVVTESLNSYEYLRGHESVIANMSGAVINLILIMLLGKVYEKLAYVLTDWEMHRTQSEFDNHFTFKVIIFQFINFYSSIFYIAFIKGRFRGYPGNYNTILRFRQEDCANSSCLIELAQQFFIIMFGKQILNNIQELVLPQIQLWIRKIRIKYQDKGDLHQMEKDYRLIEYNGPFQEYLEMIIQFGFITIFVAAFPLAPVFALINNWIEIRLDAQKIVCKTRRPVADRVRDIGIWYSILNFVVHIAVISNAFLIAFTSEYLPRMLYIYENGSIDNFLNFSLAVAPINRTGYPKPCRYKDYRDLNGNLTIFYWKLQFLRLLFVCLFEHIVFSSTKLIDIIIPDVPKSLENRIKREEFLAKQKLTQAKLAPERFKSEIFLNTNENKKI